MDKLDFSALCSRPYSEKSTECLEVAPGISAALPSFPLPQVQDVSRLALFLCNTSSVSLQFVTC